MHMLTRDVKTSFVGCGLLNVRLSPDSDRREDISAGPSRATSEQRWRSDSSKVIHQVSRPSLLHDLSQSGYVEGAKRRDRIWLCGHRVGCNIGGAVVCKASIAAVVLALGIVSLVQEGTNAMVALAGRF